MMKVKNWFNKWVSHNLWLKILSVLIAIVMWLIMVNVSNPLVSDTAEVAVDILHEDVLENADLTYDVVGRKTVTVSYDVRVRDQYKITANDFYAYADLNQLYDVTGAIPVTVELASSTARSVIEGTPVARPEVIRIQTEPIQSKRFDLTVTLDGVESDGFVAGETILTPDYVYLTAAESVIGQISAAGVEISIDGADSDLEGTAEVYLYDANGHRLDLEDQVDINPDFVDYQTLILRVKTLALDFEVSGTVAPGYRFTGVECDVSSVSVQGLRSTLASLSTLTIPEEMLNVNGARGDVEVTVNLADILPDNVTLANDEDSVISIVLNVEQLETRTESYPLSDVVFERSEDGYEYHFDQDFLSLQVRGLSEDLDSFREDNVSVSLDLAGLEAGEYPAEFVITLSEGFELVGYDPVILIVEDLEGENENSAAGSVSGASVGEGDSESAAVDNGSLGDEEDQNE